MKKIIIVLCFLMGLNAFAARNFNLPPVQSREAEAFAKVFTDVGVVWTPAASEGEVLNIQRVACSTGMTNSCKIDFFNDRGLASLHLLSDVQASFVNDLRANGVVTVHPQGPQQVSLRDVVCQRRVIQPQVLPETRPGTGRSGRRIVRPIPSVTVVTCRGVDNLAR